jgi:hypothetical protein
MLDEVTSGLCLRSNRIWFHIHIHIQFRRGVYLVIWCCAADFKEIYVWAKNSLYYVFMYANYSPRGVASDLFSTSLILEDD